MQILAFPPYREALIESGALVYCAELLAIKIAQWSESSMSAGWIHDIEFDLWLQIKEPRKEKPSHTDLDEKNYQAFKELGEFIGGWVTRLDNGDFIYMPDAVFSQYFRKTQPESYQERFRATFGYLLDSLGESQRRHREMHGTEEITEEEINQIVDEVQAEIQAEKDAGTYIEPIGTRRLFEAFAAYEHWLAAQP
jgi:hypothetical protein